MRNRLKRGSEETILISCMNYKNSYLIYGNVFYYEKCTSIEKLFSTCNFLGWILKYMAIVL